MATMISRGHEGEGEEAIAQALAKRGALGRCPTGHRDGQGEQGSARANRGAR